MNISKDTAREFTLRKQCFRLSRSSLNKQTVLNLLTDLGCVQIDSINVVERSHYLAFWSRLGCYRKEWLDDLLSRDRKVFEYWAHAASLIPIENYRFFIPAMKERKRLLKSRAKEYLKNDAGLLDTVLKRISKEGPLSSKDFSNDQKIKISSGWWNWKPAKHALELLFGAGLLMVSRRENFQRYYDLTENVLPPNIDTEEPTLDERKCFFLTKALDALGLAKPADIGQYFYTWSTKTPLGVKALSPLVKQLANEGVLERVAVDTGSGYLVLTKNLNDLKETAQAADDADTVTLLSPFDNLTWSKSRTKDIFDFEPKLEVYLPRKNRKFGYYALNILYGNRVVGKLDPKIRRDESTLEIRAVKLEEKFRVTKHFGHQFSLALKDFMAFHGVNNCKMPDDCPQFLNKTDL